MVHQEQAMSVDPPEQGGAVQEAAGGPERRSTGYWIFVLLVLVLLSEETAYAFNLVTPALPHMAAALGTADIVWVSTSFSLVGGILAPLIGKLGDIYGKKRVLLCVVGVMAAGSLVVALAQSLTVVLVGRAMEGVAISIVPLVYSLMRDIFPKKLVAIGISVVMSGLALTGMLGPILAGFLIDNFGYQGVFYFLAVFPVLLGVLVLVVVPESAVRVRATVDWTGALLLGVAVGLALLGVSQGATWGWVSASTLGCLLGGVVVFLGWVSYEKRPRFPLVDIALVRGRSLMTTMLAQFAAQGVIVLQFVLLSFVVQVPRSLGGDYGLGRDASGLAWFTTPGALISMLTGFAVGFIANRRGARNPLLVGFVFAVAGCVLLALMHQEAWQVMLGWFIFAFGGGLLNASIPNLVVASVPPEQQAVSAGTVNLVGGVAAAVVVQITFVILASDVRTVIEGSPIYSGTAFTWAYLFGGAVCLVGLAATLAMRHGRRSMIDEVSGPQLAPVH